MVFGVVYRIRCNITGDDYYGSTVDFQQRRRRHRSGSTTASETIIQRGNWTMTVVELVEESKMKERENYYITFYPCVNKYRSIGDKDRRNLSQQDYYWRHKEQIDERNSQKFDCECGGKYTRCEKTRHYKSIRHQAFRKM